MMRVMKCLAIVATICLFVAPSAPAQDAKKGKKEGAKGVIAVFAFDGPIVEKPRGEELALFSGIAPTSLKDLLERLTKAKDDKDVKAVVLLLDQVSLGMAQIEEVREALAAMHGGQRSVCPRRFLVGDPGSGAGRRGHADQRHAHGSDHDYRLQRRVALPARALGCNRREARLSHLRRVQERRGDADAQGAEPRGRAG